MRLFLLAATMLAVSGPAMAATPSAAPAPSPPPPPTPPRVFTLAGYAEPAIPASSCKNMDASQTRCLIPGMTAGVYLAEVAVTSTATAADAAQELVIAAGDQQCRVRSVADPKAPWAIGTKHTLHIGCAFTIITDTPLVVAVVYGARSATQDPAGPVMSLIPEAWQGALNNLTVTFNPAPAAAAPAAPR